MPARCIANGCTPEDCVCWEDELDPAEESLLDALTGLHPGLISTERGWLSEFVEDGVLLSVLDANLTLVRLYLDRRDGVVYTVPADIDDTEAMREALADPDRRPELHVALSRPTPLPFETTEPETNDPGTSNPGTSNPGTSNPVSRSRQPAPSWSRPAPDACASRQRAGGQVHRAAHRQRHAHRGRGRR